MRTLTGRVWGSRLRLRHVVVPLVSRRRRRFCHGLLLVHRRGRCVFPRWHSFVYGVQTLGLGERGNFVIRWKTLESCTTEKRKRWSRMSKHVGSIRPTKPLQRDFLSYTIIQLYYWNVHYRRIIIIEIRYFCFLNVSLHDRIVKYTVRCIF